MTDASSRTLGFNVHILSPVSDNYPSGIKENKSVRLDWVSNLEPLALESDGLQTALHSPAALRVMTCMQLFYLLGLNLYPMWEHIVFSACHNVKTDLKGKRRLDNWTDGSWRDIIEDFKKRI